MEASVGGSPTSERLTGSSWLEQTELMVRPEAVLIRPSTAEDFDAWFALYDAVAAEGKWIGGESPSDRAALRQDFERHLGSEDGVTLLAEANDELVGMLDVGLCRGVASFGMLVEARRRHQGIGSRLVEACISWAAEHGAHKISCTVWPHNAVALALYRKYGFVDEARLRRHDRRRNGQLWDGIGMGLVLDWEAPGSVYGS